MIGRAAIGAPWIFNQIKAYLFKGEKIEEPSVEEKITIIQKHLQKSIEWKGKALGILEMRPHYSNYLKGLPNIKPYRTRLVTTNDEQELQFILEEILNEYAGIELY
jgi:tRNA-dihydrouridine synthase B